MPGTSYAANKPKTSLKQVASQTMRMANNQRRGAPPRRTQAELNGHVSSAARAQQGKKQCDEYRRMLAARPAEKPITKPAPRARDLVAEKKRKERQVKVMEAMFSSTTPKALPVRQGAGVKQVLAEQAKKEAEEMEKMENERLRMIERQAMIDLWQKEYLERQRYAEESEESEEE